MPNERNSTLDLAVVIVSWNVRDLVLQAIRSVRDDLRASGLSSEIWVIDNASTDDTVEAIQAQFSDVRVIASAENLGFVRGNNRVLRQIGFKLPDTPLPLNAAVTQARIGDAKIALPNAVYLLNPDTITTSGATRALYEALMHDPKVGLVGARLTYEDGSFQHSAFMFPGLRQLWTEFFPTPGRLIENRFNGRYPRAFYEGVQPFPVDFVLGATMMLKREVIERTGAFDHEFFMYCEEIDWAWRIRNTGYSVMCVPSAHSVHLAGKSTAQMRPQAMVYLWQSRLCLYDKHYPTWKARLARWMIIQGMRRKIAQTDDAALRDAYRQIEQLAIKNYQHKDTN